VLAPIRHSGAGATLNEACISVEVLARRIIVGGGSSVDARRQDPACRPSFRRRHGEKPQELKQAPEKKQYFAFFFAASLMAIKAAVAA
jgi:hypothetical protein